MLAVICATLEGKTATEQEIVRHCSVERPTPQFAQKHPLEFHLVCRRSRGQPILGDWGSSDAPGIWVHVTIKQVSAWNIKESTLHSGPVNKIPYRRIHGLIRFWSRGDSDLARRLSLPPEKPRVSSADRRDDHLMAAKHAYTSRPGNITPSPRTKGGAS